MLVLLLLAKQCGTKNWDALHLVRTGCIGCMYSGTKIWARPIMIYMLGLVRKWNKIYHATGGLYDTHMYTCMSAQSCPVDKKWDANNID
jgi:hypothetical protein